jgi:hypothetical protein
MKDPRETVERRVRRAAGRTLNKEKVIAQMIDRIKDLLATEKSSTEIT